MYLSDRQKISGNFRNQWKVLKNKLHEIGANELTEILG